MRKNSLTGKVTKLMLCVVAVMSLSACGSKQVEIPNPFKECNSLEDAAAVAGFEMIAPDGIDGYEEKSITALENDMIQVLYQHEDNGTATETTAGVTEEAMTDWIAQVQ